MCSANLILVLDDSEELLELMKLFIERIAGEKAVVARTYKELLDLGPQAIECRLAILDINLGAHQPSGIDAYHWLRSSGCKAPIIFLTGHAESFPLVADAQKLSGAKVYRKPLAVDALLKIIKEATNGN